MQQEGQGFDEAVQSNQAMMLFKTNYSRIPKTQFIDVSAKKERDQQQKKPKPKLLMKKRDGPMGIGTGPKVLNTKKPGRCFGMFILGHVSVVSCQCVTKILDVVS